jgi:hypothetical protein
MYIKRCRQTIADHIEAHGKYIRPPTINDISSDSESGMSMEINDEIPGNDVEIPMEDQIAGNLINTLFQYLFCTYFALIWYLFCFSDLTIQEYSHFLSSSESDPSSSSSSESEQDISIPALPENKRVVNIIPKKKLGRPFRVLPDMNVPLYPGCEMTNGEATLRFLQLQVDNRVPQVCIKKIFDVAASMLPANHTLPDHETSKSALIQHHLPKCQVVHCCKQHCVVFIDLPYLNIYNADKQRCPKCRTPRFNSNGKPNMVIQYLFCTYFVLI